MSSELIIWLTVVLGILGFGMGSMLWAYRRPLGASVLFSEPVPAPLLPVGDRARTQFQTGCNAFRRGRFTQAMTEFTAVMNAEPACAEAFHNYGLACANLGNDGLAVQALVKASDFYDQQGNKAGLDRVKQDLEQLADRQRRRVMEKASA
jgi:hypothetical protein